MGMTAILINGQWSFVQIFNPTELKKFGPHYENKPIQIYWKFYHPKMKIFG